MTRRPRILLDCDGVLSDFVGQLLAGLKSDGSIPWSVTPEDIVDYDCAKSLGITWDVINRWTCAPGFCATMAPYPHATALLAGLQEIGEVTVVTAPYRGAPFWIAERVDWLERTFGLVGDRVCVWSEKHRIDGDVLIDDGPKQVANFAATGRRAFLVARPWNANLALPELVARGSLEWIVEAARTALVEAA
jgi:5'(3')-deoxyribonucleotidase